MIMIVSIIQKKSKTKVYWIIKFTSVTCTVWFMKQQIETISYLDPGHGRGRQTESCPGSGQQAHDKCHVTRRFVPRDRASLRCDQPAVHRDGIQLLWIATLALH